MIQKYLLNFFLFMLVLNIEIGGEGGKSNNICIKILNFAP
jgi:hypothetical protein